MPVSFLDPLWFQEGDVLGLELKLATMGQVSLARITCIFPILCELVPKLPFPSSLCLAPVTAFCFLFSVLLLVSPTRSSPMWGI
jgi:hypothetical protein